MSEEQQATEWVQKNLLVVGDGIRFNLVKVEKVKK
jgi:hypothetical protein